MAKIPTVVTEKEKAEAAQKKVVAAQKTLVKLKEELLSTEISYGKSLMILRELLQNKMLEIKSIVANEERVALFEKAIQSAIEANNKTKEMLVKLNSENLSPAEYIKISGEFIAANVIPQLSNGLLAYAGFNELSVPKKEKLEKLANGGLAFNLSSMTQRGPRYDLLYKEINTQNNIILGKSENNKDRDKVLENIKNANKINNHALGEYVENLAKAAKNNATELSKNFMDKGRPKNGGEPKIVINQIPRKFKLDNANLDLIKEKLGNNFSVSKRSGGFFGNDSFIVTDSFGQSVMKISLNTKFFFGESSMIIQPLIDPKSKSNSVNSQGVIEAMVKTASAMEGSVSKISKFDRGGSIDIKSTQDFVQPILNSMLSNDYLTEALSTTTKNKYAKELMESYKTLDHSKTTNTETETSAANSVASFEVPTTKNEAEEIIKPPPLLSESMKEIQNKSSELQKQEAPKQDRSVNFLKKNQEEGYNIQPGVDAKIALDKKDQRRPRR